MCAKFYRFTLSSFKVIIKVHVFFDTPSYVNSMCLMICVDLKYKGGELPVPGRPTNLG